MSDTGYDPNCKCYYCNLHREEQATGIARKPVIAESHPNDIPDTLHRLVGLCTLDGAPQYDIDAAIFCADDKEFMVRVPCKGVALREITAR